MVLAPRDEATEEEAGVDSDVSHGTIVSKNSNGKLILCITGFSFSTHLLSKPNMAESASGCSTISRYALEAGSARLVKAMVPRFHGKCDSHEQPKGR